MCYRLRQVDRAVVERMLGDHQQRLGRCMRCKGAQYRVDGYQHAASGCVEADLRIGVELQREQEIGDAALPQSTGALQRLLPAPSLKRETLHPHRIFHKRMPGAVTAIVRKPPSAEHGGGVIGHIVPSTTTEVGGDGLTGAPCRQTGSSSEIALRIARQTRMTIDAAGFQRHVIRPQIAFFKYLHRDTALARQLDRRHMQRPAITEQDEVGDGPSPTLLEQKRRPGCSGAGEVETARQPPEAPIAAIEIDAVDGIPAPMQAQAQVGKKVADLSL